MLLRRGDYEQTLSFLQRLYRQRDAAAFACWLVEELPSLVACDHATWNDMALSVSYAEVVEAPVLPGIERRCEAFSRLMLEHPCLRHWVRTGETRPLFLSDFLSARELHATRLYDELYRELRYEDQVGLCLTPPQATTRAVAVARDRRSFTERDRRVLELVRPHLAQAYENAHALGRAQRQVGSTRADGVSLIELDRNGRIRDLPARAESWLRHYLADARPGRAAELPERLERWLRARGHDEHRLLVITRGGGRLIVRQFPLDPGALLLLEERTTPSGAAPLRALGLTPRELEVLLEVEKGKRNAEIAAALFVSPRTVKKHLENIYTKLEVKTRTEAVARLRAFRSSP